MANKKEEKIIYWICTPQTDERVISDTDVGRMEQIHYYINVDNTDNTYYYIIGMYIIYFWLNGIYLNLTSF